MNEQRARIAGLREAAGICEPIGQYGATCAEAIRARADELERELNAADREPRSRAGGSCYGPIATPESAAPSTAAMAQRSEDTQDTSPVVPTETPAPATIKPAPSVALPPLPNAFNCGDSYEIHVLASDYDALRTAAELLQAEDERMAELIRVSAGQIVDLRAVAVGLEKQLRDVLDCDRRNEMEACARAERAEAEAARNREDAERYRWLRSEYSAVAEVCNKAIPRDDGFIFMDGDDLDAAIDATRRKHA